MAQMAGHTDPSSAEVYETMGLQGKLTLSNYAQEASEVGRDIESYVGQLMLPFQNHAYQLRPGRDILHIQLTETVHVPDDSRGQTNYSMVNHKPKQ